jgi:hypothetical protein
MTDNSAVADVRFTRMMKPGKLKRRAFIKTVKCFCWNPNYTTPTKVVKNDLGIFSMMIEKRDE